MVYWGGQLIVPQSATIECLLIDGQPIEAP
jgi:hypothetical protein